LYWRIGKLEDSISFLEEALEIQSQILVDAQLSRTLYNIGIARSLKGDYDLALQALKRSLKAQLALDGYVEVARINDAIGKIYLLQGDVEKAILCHQDALKVKKVLLGESHPGVIFSMMNLAAAHLTKGDIDLAIKGYRDAILSQKTTLSGISSESERNLAMIDLGDSFHKLGSILMKRNESAEAAKELREGADYYRRAGLAESDRRIIALMKTTQKTPVTLTCYGSI